MFSVQLRQLSSMEYLHLKTAKESRRAEPTLCAISVQTFRKGSVLTALVPKKSVAQPVGSIKVDQKVGGKPVVVEDKNKSLADKIQENANEVSCREKIESNNPGSTVGDADKSKSSFVSSCEQTRSNALSSTSTTANNKQ